MKKMKKLFILITSLLIGSSVGATNNANKAVVADAAESGTSAYIDFGWKSTVAESETINTLLITNDSRKIELPTSELIAAYDITCADYTGEKINAYVYSVNDGSRTIQECIIYTVAETIYTDFAPGLFSNLTNVEKITFDLGETGKFSLAKTNNMCNMFSENYNLVQIEGLTQVTDTDKVQLMESIFYNCSSLTSVDISSFNPSRATSIAQMFRGCGALTTINGLTSENWNTSSVTNMDFMFSGCHSLTSLNVSGFETGNVEKMRGMFDGCKTLTTIEGLNTLNTSKVTDMYSMFSGCEKITSIDVSSFDTSSVTTMGFMFSSCTALTTINGLTGENWNTSLVQDMSFMFMNCKGLKSIDVSGFETESVTNMSYMFEGCNYIENINGLNNFNTSQVTDMGNMFGNCSKLKSVDVSSFDTSNVTNMYYMFASCSSLETLDISSFNLKSISKDNTNALKKIIASASSLKVIKTPSNLNGNTIALPYNFGMSEIEPTMENMTLIRGSKELNMLYNTLKTLETCKRYMEGPELQTIYDGLSTEDKATFATLTDDDGVSLIDKLTYMVSYAATKSDTGSATAGKNLVASDIASQSPVLVILIGCVSVAFIGGYYLAQKRKYAK